MGLRGEEQLPGEHWACAGLHCCGHPSFLMHKSRVDSNEDFPGKFTAFSAHLTKSQDHVAIREPRLLWSEQMDTQTQASSSLT